MTNHPLCAVDQRPVHDGGQLCTQCWADLRQDLAELPELLHDLDRVLARLTKTGGGSIGIVVRAERGLTFDERAGDLLRQIHNTLGGWVRVLCEDNALPVDVADRTADLAQWLGRHEREVRRHEATGDLWQEIHDLAERARRITRPAPASKVYLGQCSEPLDDADGEPIYCTEDLYAPEGRTSITCPGCSTVHQISQRRETMLGAVADQLLTAVEASRALTSMTGREVSVNTIRSWAHRGKLVQHEPREGERSPRYRIGDISELLEPTPKAS